MDNLNDQVEEYLYFKIIQSGEIKKFSLTVANLKKKFKEIYFSLLKELNLKSEDTYVSNEEGKMIGSTDLLLPLENIIKKFGTNLRIYYEKIF